MTPLLACMLSSAVAFSPSSGIRKASLVWERPRLPMRMTDDPLSNMLGQDADVTIARLTSSLSKDELKQACAERSLGVSGCVHAA